jgi:hypothetical protein
MGGGFPAWSAASSGSGELVDGGHVVVDDGEAGTPGLFEGADRPLMGLVGPGWAALAVAARRST